MQQQTRAIHIVRAEPQKSQMIKRNHRFISSKDSHTMIFGELARRPLVAISSSDTLRTSALACICQEPSPAVSVALAKGMVNTWETGPIPSSMTCRKGRR